MRLPELRAAVAEAKAALFDHANAATCRTCADASALRAAPLSAYPAAIARRLRAVRIRAKRARRCRLGLALWRKRRG